MTMDVHGIHCLLDQARIAACTPPHIPLITTAFTKVFRSTLIFGLPFLAMLVLLYNCRYRPAVSRYAETTRNN